MRISTFLLGISGKFSPVRWLYLDTISLVGILTLKLRSSLITPLWPHQKRGTSVISAERRDIECCARGYPRPDAQPGGGACGEFAPPKFRNIA